MGCSRFFSSAYPGNVSLLTPERYWQMLGWIYRSGSQSVHVKVMQPNSLSPCPAYATRMLTSATNILMVSLVGGCILSEGLWR